jgi:hypothetical protein
MTASMEMHVPDANLFWSSLIITMEKSTYAVDDYQVFYLTDFAQSVQTEERRQTGTPKYFVRFVGFNNFQFRRIRLGIDDMNPRRSQPGQDEVAATLRL